MSGKKRILAFVLSFVMVFSCIIPMGIQSKTVYAGTTESQVKSKINKINKDLKKLNAQYKKEVAAEKKQKKGTIPIIGEVISYNPAIVKGLFGGYYWILNSKNMDSMFILASGNVKKTGKTRVYYDGISRYTCIECKAVKVSNKSKNTKKKIDSLKKELKVCKNALNDFVHMNYSSYSVPVGLQTNIDFELYYGTGKYNSISWKSSNPDIVTVSKNGIITGKKEGTATITAVTSCSKMKTQREVTVVKLSDVIHFTESEKTIQINDMNQTVKIYMDENYAFDNEEICIDYDEKYVRVEEYDYDTYTITPLNPGVTKLELKVNGKSVGTMILTIENIPEYSDENYFDDDYYW